jgi:5,10-methylenetetrahydrofolate reductase
MTLLESLRSGRPTIAAELRPPRAELESREGMDAWIDMYHASRALARQDVTVFLTDSAVGTQEENNLRHLVTNLGRDVPRDHVVPFLTTKHSLDFCLSYAEQAWQHGFSSLVVLGGDRTVGRARCVEHAWELRRHIRAREPRLTLGGWANPHADPVRQVDYVADPDFTAEFYLTQIVSHLDVDPVKRFIDEIGRRRLEHVPGMFGVFYYRSANPKTLEILNQFLPVPSAPLTAEFASGATPIEICARTLRTLGALGARHFYISNLPLLNAASTLERILDHAGPPFARVERHAQRSFR